MDNATSIQFQAWYETLGTQTKPKEVYDDRSTKDIDIVDAKILGDGKIYESKEG